jgi:1,2-diacylglycerol 3-beta-galactosyltransferase
MLKKGWTLGSSQLTRFMHGIIRLYHPAQVRILTEHWRANRADLIASVIPNFNRALKEGLQNSMPATPLVTVMTDLADYPPHFWIERQEQYLVCGTDRALAQARAMGYTEDRLFRVSGMILNPRFYELADVDRREARQALGLDPELPTGLVLFGGAGSGVIQEIARRLDASGLKAQLILVCGHNQGLAERLRAMKATIPMHVEGFTKEIPRLMQLSDFFIGKPGPGSISEAIAMHLPVIVECNAWTLPQERYNADWVMERKAGLVLPNFRGIAGAVRQMLEPDQYQRFRANAAALKNRAVFEIPDILAKILPFT